MIENRYDFTILFDVENGNPNGDPDAGNTPRIDAESGLGYVTDVCLKRKIRNYVELTMADKRSEDGSKAYNILVKMDKSLNTKFTEAYKATGLALNPKGSKTKDKIKEETARKWICDNYYDVRMFGAVMNTGDNPAGIVRGPVQINFAQSQSPSSIQVISITRQAITKDEEFGTKNNEMGKKTFIPYGLYRADGYISAALANKTTDITDEDIELLWNAIINMFEHDHSAARGKMTVRKLIVFKHDDILGNAPSHILFDKIRITENSPVPRSFNDYDIHIDADMPDGVTIEEML